MITLVVYIFTILVNTESADNVTDGSNNDLLYRVNEEKITNIKNLANKLLITFGLANDFMKRQQIQILYNIHSNLSQMSEVNSNRYRDIADASRSDVPLIKSCFDLDKSFIDTLAAYKNRCYEEWRSSLEFFELVSNEIDKINNHQDYVFRREIYEIWRPSNSSEETNDRRSRRLYNGHSTDVLEFPFVASIHLLGNLVCGGSIISRNMVLTAAACLQTDVDTDSGSVTKAFSVRVGSDYPHSNGMMIPIVARHFYPTYDSARLQDNIAIVELDRKLKFSKYLMRVKFDSSARPLDPSTRSITLLGWDNQENEIKNNSLGYTDMDIYNLKNCKAVYTDAFVGDKNFCAGYTRKTSACEKDIGGPALLESILVGVVSFGPPVCGTPDTPTVFTQVGYYADWINETINMIPTPKPATRKETFPQYQEISEKTIEVRLTNPTRATQPTEDDRKIQEDTTIRPPIQPILTDFEDREPLIVNMKSNNILNQILPVDKNNYKELTKRNELAEKLTNIMEGILRALTSTTSTTPTSVYTESRNIVNLAKYTTSNGPSFRINQNNVQNDTSIYTDNYDIDYSVNLSKDILTSKEKIINPRSFYEKKYNVKFEKKTVATSRVVTPKLYFPLLKGLSDYTDSESSNRENISEDTESKDDSLALILK